MSRPLPAWTLPRCARRAARRFSCRSPAQCPCPDTPSACVAAETLERPERDRLQSWLSLPGYVSPCDYCRAPSECCDTLRDSGQKNQERQTKTPKDRRTKSKLFHTVFMIQRFCPTENDTGAISILFAKSSVLRKNFSLSYFWHRDCEVERETGKGRTSTPPTPDLNANRDRERV